MRLTIAGLLLATLFVLSVALLYVKVTEGQLTSAQNQGYVRYLACVADIRNEKNVIAVSNEISDACWEQAEQEIGTKLPRYSEKVLLENL